MVQFAVWIEDTGRAYVYVQYQAHSSDYSDYWVEDITDEWNQDTWGVQLEHWSDDGGHDNEIKSIMREVEIFYGMREGISQPRFGGMWWLYAPLVQLMLQWTEFWGGLWRAAMSVFIDGVQTFFGPLIQDVIDEIAPIVGGIINGFINSVIAPLWQWLRDYLIPQVFISAWLAGTGLIDSLLQALGVLLLGDANALKNAFWAFMTWLNTFVAIIVSALSVFTTTFALLSNFALGVPVLAVDLSAPMSWINGIIYYVVTFAPLAIMVHMMITMLAAVQKQDIEPLIGMAMFYFRIAEFLFNIVREVLAMLVQGVQMIMDIIPL